VLDGELFYIVLNWNESAQSWEMGIRNASYAILVSGIAVVPNYPLTWQYQYQYMPAGELVCGNPNWTNGPVPRNGFASGAYALVYITRNELLTSGWGPVLNRAV
jgi:hypothetical protein